MPTLRALANLALSGVAFVATSLRADLAFTPIGDLPGGSVSSLSQAISADGTTVVGYASSANGTEAFAWSSTGGIVGLGDLPGGDFHSQAKAVSGDGSVVVGVGNTASGFNGAWRWTSTDGLVSVPDLPGGIENGYAAGISSDGLILAAQGTNASNFSEAFLWTASTGPTPVGFFPGGNLSEVLGLSADGAVVVGRATRSTGYTAAFRWTASGSMLDLGYLPGGDSSYATAASADGSVVVGRSFVANFGQRAFRWTAATGMVDLGLLGPTGTRSEALACSADGNVIVGYSEGGAYGDSAFVWDSVNGMRSLKGLLTAAGLAKRWTQISMATGVSADGTKVTGYGVNPSGNTEAFIVDLNAPPAPPPPPATAGLVWTEDLPQTQPLLANSVVRLAYDNGTGITDIATLTGGANGGWGGVEYSGGYLLVPSSANTGSGTRVHAARYSPILVTNVKAYDLDFSPGYLWQVNGGAQQVLRTIPSGGLNNTGIGLFDRNWVNSGSQAPGRFTNAVQTVGNVVYFSSSVVDPIGLYKCEIDPATNQLGAATPVYTESGATAPAIYDFEVVGDDIYFGDITNNAIKRVRTDGTGLVTLVSAANFPNGIDVTDTHIYWTEMQTQLIRRANLDGSGVVTLLLLDNTPRGVAVVPLSLIDAPTAPQAVALSGHGTNANSTAYTGAINTPRAFTATSTSGLPVTVEVLSGPATVSGASITYTGIGVVTLLASQAGNASFAPASFTYYVNSAPRQTQSIDFPALPDLVYRGSPLTFTPTATASSGLSVSFSIVAGGTIASRNSTTGVVTVTGPGSVTIRASQIGNSTYALASVDRTFVVHNGSAPLFTFLSAAGVPVGQDLPNADPDADGCSNLLEYALDLDPMASDTTGLPIVNADAGTLSLTYRALRGDVTYLVETSTDLLTWTTAGVSQGAPAPDGQVTATVPLGAGPGFLRLKATQP